MKTWFLRLAATAVLLVALATATLAQQVQFSADMQILEATGRTDAIRLYVGEQRARLERGGTSAGPDEIGALITYHQIQYLLVPQAKVYMRMAGSESTLFYQAAWIFRPAAPDQPCGQWIAEADRRRITLRCQQLGQESASGRTTEKWEATSLQGARGFVWYDKDLNFIIRVLRTSKDGIQSGYELQNIKQGAQPKELFDIYADHRQFSLDNLIDVLTGVGQW